MLAVKISVSENAKKHLNESGMKNLKIFLKGYGWAGPVFGLAQGEPGEGDSIFPLDDYNFAVEKDIADIVNNIEIDYYKGLFQKGYVVYANGSKGSC